MSRRFLLLPTLLALGFLPAVHGQNLIFNGDFELPPHAPDSTMTGWMVGGTGHIHSINEGSTSGIYSAAFNIGHDSQGTTLSQMFATVSGTTYQVDFDSGIYGQRNDGFLQMNVQVIDSASSTVLLNKTITPPDAMTFDGGLVQFQHYQFTFTAASGSATIRFTDVGGMNASADTLVDTVSVIQAPATPATGQAPPPLTDRGVTRRIAQTRSPAETTARISGPVAR